MSKVVVTGANGFLGKLLCSRLESLGYEVLKVIRETSVEQLADYIKVANYCVHLAGEVRPKADSDSFWGSNAGFTEEILGLARQRDIALPIAFTSTVHAGRTDNDYGNSKLEAEQKIREYAGEKNANVHIYRLPHVFGPGCKANYNSVISTWIVNAIQGGELVVFDPEYQIEYVYGPDLAELFIQQMDEQQTLSLPTPFPIKLGRLKELILVIVEDSQYEPQNDFEQKLKETVLSYQKTIATEH